MWQDPGAAQVLEQASLVVIIPGYGMAVSQAQHRVRDRPHVLHRDVVAPLQHRVRLGPDDQVLAGPRPRAPQNVIFDELRRMLILGTRLRDELHGMGLVSP